MAITVQEAQVIFSADGLAQVQTKAGMAGKALDRTTTAASGLITKLKGINLNIGGMGSAFAGLGAGAAVGGMMSLAAGAEQTAISMEVFLGSAEKASKLIADLRALDMESVFGFQQLSEAAKMMLNFGVSGEEVTETLTRLSEVAAGDPMRLEALAKGFGQVTQAGRLMGQENNQLINAGFSPLAEISRTTGESMAALKKRMEDGGVSVEEVRQAFVSATSAGGRFYDLNNRLAASTGGQFAKLKSEVEMLAIAMGTTLLPEANKLLEWARKFFDQTDDMPSTFSKLQTSTQNWFTETQEKFEGVGVIVGVTAVHIADRFKDAFDDIVSIAKAAFDWIQANSGKMVDNLGARMRAMKQMLMGQEVTEFTVPLGEFQMPELKSGRGSSLMEKIDEELAAARRIKTDQMVAENEAKKGKAGKDETSVDSNKRIPKQFATQMKELGQSKTFSAEGLFASLRESTLTKQLGIAQSSLSVQQQQLSIQQQQLQAVQKLDMGLA